MPGKPDSFDALPLPATSVRGLFRHFGPGMILMMTGIGTSHLLTAPAAGGRFERRGEADRAEPPQSLRPGANRARYRHAQRAGARHPLEPLRLQFLERLGAASPSRAVQRVGQVGGRVVIQEEHVAADAVHVRARDGEHRGGGNGRVHGEPARLEHTQTGFGRERMTGGDGAGVPERVASGVGVPGDRRAAGGHHAHHDQRGGRVTR